MSWGACASAFAQSLEGPADLAETSHRIDVTLESGIAAVEEHASVVRSAGRAEIALQFALPAQATLVSVRVCHVRRCRRLVDTEGRDTTLAYAFSLHLPGTEGARHGDGPMATATRNTDGVLVHVAPVDAAATTIDVRYATSLAIHEGRARFVIPASGFDARRAATDVSVTSTELDALSIDGGGAHASVDASSPITIEGVVAAPIASSHRRDGITRAFAAAPRVVLPHDVVLAIDVSPSMEDVPDGRMDAALRATLAALPTGSRVRALRFGARAEWATADESMPAWQAPSAIAPDAILDLEFGALGSRTLYAPIAERVTEAMGDATSPILIVLGDGWLDGADFSALAREGARVVVVDVGDEPFWRDVDAAARATPSALEVAIGAQLAGRDGTPIAAIVAEPAEPVSLVDALGDRVAAATVPSGEAFTFAIDEPVRVDAIGTSIPTLAAPWSVLAPAMPIETIAVDPRVWSAVLKWETDGSTSRYVAGGLGGLDDAITWAAYAPDVDGTGLHTRVSHAPMIALAPPEVRMAPSSHELRRVMQRLTPRVRCCFAEARRGRPAWSARADVQVVLGHREVISGTVSNVDATLAACIARGFDTLQVPPSDYVMRLNYPFRAEPIERPTAPSDPTLEPLFGPVDPSAMDAEMRALIAQP